MTGLPQPTYLAESLSNTDSQMCLVGQYDEVCALLREPSHVYATIGNETVVITGCLPDGKVAILRGADGSTIANSVPSSAPVCFTKAVMSPMCERLLPTACNQCTCGCCDKSEEE